MSDTAKLENDVRGLVKEGRLRDAAVVCDQLNREFPDYDAGWFTTSQLALLLNEPRLALEAINQALHLAPGKPEWVLHQIECLGAMGESGTAAALAQQLATHRFDTAELAARFGLALTKLGLFELALSQYERACELEPNNSKHHIELASAWRYLGNLDKAEAVLEACIRMNPHDSNLHLHRAGLNTQTREANHIADLEAAYSRSPDDPVGRVRLCFALAKELEDIGEYERSFEYLTEGCELHRQRLGYNTAADLDALHAVRENYGPEIFDGSIEGHISAEPIFVFGMPRSGITLVERILVRHPAVQFAGELRNFSYELIKHTQRVSGGATQTPPEMVARSKEIDFVALGQDYIDGTRPATGLKAHFVDKQSLNFQYAGLMHLALPKAKLVVLRRDPMDNCYALLKALFEDRFAFSYDLAELANFYVAHSELIDHWQSVMPDVMHVIRYEELISDPRPVIEGLLGFCSLSLDEECLQFETDRIDTIGMWRNFSRQLQPMAAIFEAAGVRFT